jgi:hypothetical protein
MMYTSESFQRIERITMIEHINDMHAALGLSPFIPDENDTTTNSNLRRTLNDLRKAQAQRLAVMSLK